VCVRACLHTSKIMANVCHRPAPAFVTTKVSAPAQPATRAFIMKATILHFNDVAPTAARPRPRPVLRLHVLPAMLEIQRVIARCCLILIIPEETVMAASRRMWDHRYRSSGWVPGTLVDTTARDMALAVCTSGYSMWVF